MFAAISPGIIAFTLYTKVQKYVGASLAGFTLYIFSIYSAIYGIILFDEPILSFHYYGATFVFVGVYLARKVFKMKYLYLILSSINNCLFGCNYFYLFLSKKFTLSSIRK